MFTLVTDRSRFYRVKRGQVACDVEKALNTPANGNAFPGAIIAVCDKKLKAYTVKVGDTYRTVAQKFFVREEELKKLNGNKPVYPTCKLFVPCE